MSDAVDPSAAAEKLTGLEREFLGLVVAGESTERITLRLAISEARAREVQQSLKSKLEARTTADLVRAGLVAGL
jgi:FixJ family two-component response regulator